MFRQPTPVFSRGVEREARSLHLPSLTPGADAAPAVVVAPPAIEAEVAKALRRDIKGIAGTLVASVAGAVASPYGVKIELLEAGRDLG